MWCHDQRSSASSGKLAPHTSHTLDVCRPIQSLDCQLAKLEAEIVVAKGLTAGDRVIIEGAQKVRPQQVVQAAEATRG